MKRNEITFKQPVEALGRNGVFKMAGVVVNGFSTEQTVYVNPVTSKNQMARAWMNIPMEHAEEFALAVLEAAGREVKLSYRELSTILAALRLFQAESDFGRNPQAASHFDDCTALDDNEIDELCERLNIDFPTQTYDEAKAAGDLGGEFDDEKEAL